MKHTTTFGVLWTVAICFWLLVPRCHQAGLNREFFVWDEPCFNVWYIVDYSYELQVPSCRQANFSKALGAFSDFPLLSPYFQHFLLSASQQPIYKTCGNGIVEAGEECDCGSEEDCERDPCCERLYCRLKTTSECSSNSPCCENCKVRGIYCIFQ